MKTWNDGLRLLGDEERAYRVAERRPCSIGECGTYPTYAQSFNHPNRVGGTAWREQLVCDVHAERFARLRGIVLPTEVTVRPVHASDELTSPR